MLRSKVRISTLCLATLGLFDLVTTIMLMNQGVKEGNPIFRGLAEHGMLPFAVGKILLLAGPIALLEYVRTKHPKSAEQGTWVAFAAYGALYVYHLTTLTRA